MLEVPDRKQRRSELTLATQHHLRAAALARGLYPHQVEGLAFLLARKCAILADDMGLGKTRQAILALVTAAPAGPYLVVCPASVKRNWSREIELARPGSSVHVMGEPPPPDWNGWVIVNYELLDRHLERLLALDVVGLVFDEAHYLKNHSSKRSRLARRLAEGRPLTYLLTGTPLTSRPRDLFPLLQLIQHPLGRHFLSFAKRYCAAWHNGFGWNTDGASHLDELALELKGVLMRRTKDQVLDLPPKVRTFLEVDVPVGTAQRETKALVELLLGSALDRSAPVGSALEGGGASSGPLRASSVVARLTRARHVLAKAKAKATLDFVDGAVEQGEKVLVFSAFDEPLKKVQQHFGARCVLCTGETPVARRQALVDRFQSDPEVRVFATSLQAGGVGLNLTAARQVVFNDLDWVPANHWQAEDRAYRIGQTGSVHVTYLVASGTLDSFVRALLESKAHLIAEVIDGQGSVPSFSGNALTDFESRLRALAPELAAEGLDRADGLNLQRLIERAAASTRTDSPGPPPDRVAPALHHAELLERLTNALAGPAITRYQLTSPKDPARTFQLEASGLDVTCNCSGFEHRGTCSHARTLKEALVRGAASTGLDLEVTRDAVGQALSVRADVEGRTMRYTRVD